MGWQRGMTEKKNWHLDIYISNCGLVCIYVIFFINIYGSVTFISFLKLAFIVYSNGFPVFCFMVVPKFHIYQVS